MIHGGSDEGKAEQTAAAARGAGAQTKIVMADLGADGASQELVRAAWEWRQGVDVWINNAGVDVLTGDAANWTFDEKLRRLWEVDVRGTIQCSRLVGQLMKQAGAGVITNIGWDQAWQGMEGDSGEMFAAVKGGIMAFSKSLAKSLAPEVRVNCVAPGWIKTTWGDENASDYWHRRALSESLRNRWGKPEDVAHVCHFLASADADFVNGQVIPVNGGFRAAPPKQSP